VAVLDHDGIVGGGRRKRPIAERPRSALPTHIPAIDELLEACGHDYHLSLDLKDPAAGPVVIAAVRDAAPELLPRLWLHHPDSAVLVALRPLDRDVKLVESTRLARMKEGPERRAAALRNAGVDAVNLHHTDWTGGLTTLFHRFGRYALAWDLQFDHVLRNALRMGIDGVFSDWVDRMNDAFAAEGVASR
jgi:glycerophosphoryl diester phosphodiesterase